MDMKSFENLELTKSILHKISSIDEFRGRWEVVGNMKPEYLAAMRRTTTIESTGSSTRIEGSKLSNDEVAHVLAGLDIKSFGSRDEQEVAGYGEAMDHVFNSWQAIPLTENYIKQLHQVILKHSTKDSRHRGDYKKFPNHVEARDLEGNTIGIIFETSSPFDTPGLMKDLVSESARMLEQKSPHPLLVIGLFVLRFLSIHPFQDGNGRLSRALTNLLMLQAGYSYVPYRSHERVIEDNKESYYIALREAQKDLSDPHSVNIWVEFFLDSLVAQKNALREVLDRVESSEELPEISLEILELASTKGRVTVREIVAASQISRNTVKFHLKKLVADNYLKRQGRGRGTWYVPARTNPR